MRNGKQCAAVQRELLDTRQVPHLGLQLTLVCSIMLQTSQEGNEASTKYQWLELTLVLCYYILHKIMHFAGGGREEEV